MTEREIQNRLFWDVHTSLILMPNFTPPRWFECDLFAVTQAGYMREYEIKLSVADLRADKKKSQRSRDTGWQDEYKHDLLSRGDARGPKQFWFVVPEKLVLLAGEVPTFAGLLTVRDNRGRIMLHEARPAPVLHKEKVSPKAIEYARKVCYHRYWRERFELDRARKERDQSARFAATA